MRIMLKKRIYLIFTLFLSLFLLTNYSLARAQDKDKILSLSDVKIYKKIFEIQKKQIKNKKSKEWKDVDRLISELKNKIQKLKLDSQLIEISSIKKDEELKKLKEENNDLQEEILFYEKIVGKRR